MLATAYSSEAGVLRRPTTATPGPTRIPAFATPRCPSGRSWPPRRSPTSCWSPGSRPVSSRWGSIGACHLPSAIGPVSSWASGSGWGCTARRTAPRVRGAATSRRWSSTATSPARWASRSSSSTRSCRRCARCITAPSSARSARSATPAKPIVITEPVPAHVTLHELLTAARTRGVRLPQEIAAAVARAVIDGAATAHAADAVHGAIHPRSVLIGWPRVRRQERRSVHGPRFIGRQLAVGVSDGCWCECAIQCLRTRRAAVCCRVQRGKHDSAQREGRQCLAVCAARHDGPGRARTRCWSRRAWRSLRRRGHGGCQPGGRRADLPADVRVLPPRNRCWRPRRDAADWRHRHTVECTDHP